MPKLALFRSLSSRNFRLFFIGQGISLIGMWMQQIAMSWLVYQMTGSSLALGAVLFFGQIPSLVLSPFIGVFIDRWDRRLVFEACQWLAMLEALMLAALAYTGHIQVWQIMTLSLFAGIVTAFDMASRQALMVRFVDDKKDLSNAIALGATMFNGSRLIGPALGGFILAASSAAVCFFLNALSFLAVIIALHRMTLPRALRTKTQTSYLSDIADGFRYAYRETALRNCLLAVALGSIASSGYSVLLPVMTVHSLGGGAQEMGWLGAAMGVGALCAALFLASRKTVMGTETWIGAGLCLFALAQLALPWMNNLYTAAIIYALFGFGMVAHFASGNTILQTIVKEHMRGRVMSLYSMALMGMTPLGTMGAGYLNETLGLGRTLTLCGTLALAGGVAFLLWLPQLRGKLRAVTEAPPELAL